MSDHDWLAARFEENRGHLRAVAYRILGTLPEADDAVQEAWLRLTRSDAVAIDNLGGWLTTVVARICLNALRARQTRREEPFGLRVPDPIVSRAGGVDPEQATLVADSVGLALLVILQTLEPDERLAFVLHDMFAVPFEEIAPIVGRTPAAARQLASRARRRVQGAAPEPERDPVRQREVVDAFVAAVRDGDLDRLLAVLDPDVVLNADGGTVRPGATRTERGARTVAEGALAFARRASIVARPALVNGAAGLVGLAPGGHVVSVMGFTVVAGRIVQLDLLTDPARLRHVDVSMLDL
jgi:RNA polymerase sigma-70 factor (ECF subfamily)